MAIRPLHVLAAAGIVVSAAVVSAVVTRAPAVSPTPAVTATPIATPAPGSDRYGLIVGTRVGTSVGTSVRSEVDPRELATLATAYFNGGVSPDGRKVAYWETPRDGSARVLRLVEGSAPAQPRVVLTLPETEMAAVSTGGGVVWSSDGTALLIGVNSREYTPGPVDGSRPLYAALRTVDLASGTVREVIRLEFGLPLRPVALESARGIATAVEMGGGGYLASYVVARDGAAPARTRLETDIAPAIAAPDATLVLAVKFRPAPVVLVWPLAEPERRTTMELAPGEYVATAMWRNAGEIVVLVSTGTPGGERLEAWPLEGPRRVVLRGRPRLYAVRPDGTAAIVSGEVVDLVTGATWPIPGLYESIVASFLLR